MKRLLVQFSPAISLAFALAVAPAQGGAQELPSAPSVPWQAPRSLSAHLHAPGESPPLGPQAGPVDAGHPLALADLIDIAMRRNPQTRSAWESAKQSLAAKGVARSALFPTLTGLVLGETERTSILFNTMYVRQTVGGYEPELELTYTVFDWNARLDALRAARYDLFASDFSFNNTHLQLVDSVATSYFELLNSIGQVAAAQANLRNAQLVAAQVDARLAQGLETLPNALEARSALAQAAYQLTSVQASQSNGQAQLAVTLGLPASTVLPIVPLDRLATPEAVAETAADAIAKALEDRPDLLEQEAMVEAAKQRIEQARKAYLPSITFTGVWGRLVRAFGEQDLLPPQYYRGSGQWNVQLNLNWTLFDGGQRRSQLEEAVAAKAAAEATLDADRDQIEDQVWSAYTNLQTAYQQQQAAEALLQASQSSFDASTESLRAGVQTVVNVVTAQQQLAQALQEEVSARTNLFTQATTLVYRTGELLRSHRGPAVLPPVVAPPVPLLAPQTPGAPPAAQAPAAGGALPPPAGGG